MSFKCHLNIWNVIQDPSSLAGIFQHCLTSELSVQLRVLWRVSCFFVFYLPGFMESHPENTQLSFGPKTWGNTFADFWPLFLADLTLWYLAPYVQTPRNPDIWYLLPLPQKSAVLCLGSISLSQKSGVTVELSSYTFLLSRIISLYRQFINV